MSGLMRTINFFQPIENNICIFCTPTQNMHGCSLFGKKDVDPLRGKPFSCKMYRKAFLHSLPRRFFGFWSGRKVDFEYIALLGTKIFARRSMAKHNLTKRSSLCFSITVDFTVQMTMFCCMMSSWIVPCFLQRTVQWQ